MREKIDFNNEEGQTEKESGLELFWESLRDFKGNLDALKEEVTSVSDEKFAAMVKAAALKDLFDSLSGPQIKIAKFIGRKAADLVKSLGAFYQHIKKTIDDEVKRDLIKEEIEFFGPRISEARVRAVMLMHEIQHYTNSQRYSSIEEEKENFTEINKQLQLAKEAKQKDYKEWVELKKRIEEKISQYEKEIEDLSVPHAQCEVALAKLKKQFEEGKRKNPYEAEADSDPGEPKTE